MKKIKLPIPYGFFKANPGEIKPNMRYWLSTDGREFHFREIASTYGISTAYTEMVDSKVKSEVLYIEKK